MAKPPPSNSGTPLPPAVEDDAEGDSSSASSMSSTGTVVPTEFQRPLSSVASWHGYFEQELFLEGPDETHHAYITLPKSPSKDPLFVCHHGAGSSGISFAVLASELKARLPSAGIMSLDARGHGLTVSGDESTSPDYSLERLSNDLIQLIQLAQSRLGWQETPNMVFVGHSLGGAVVTDVAKRGTFGNKLLGFAVIDVVEGSALDALKVMNSIMSSRPSSFPSIDTAIDWHLRSRTIRNAPSAKASVPSLFRQDPSGRWVWRTDIAATEPYWEDWFSGMSKNFLAGKAAKLLILAGTDRLDKELMIGQMQGKFQLQVFPEAGHFVQEDSPEKTAEFLVEFFRRNDRSALVLPPKVGDLLKQGKKV